MPLDSELLPSHCLEHDGSWMEGWTIIVHPVGFCQPRSDASCHDGPCCQRPCSRGACSRGTACTSDSAEQCPSASLPPPSCHYSRSPGHSSGSSALWLQLQVSGALPAPLSDGTEHFASSCSGSTRAPRLTAAKCRNWSAVGRCERSPHAR